MKIRLDKWLANMGVGSRKEVKSLIRQGRVKVDGETVTVPKTKVDTSCQVEFDRKGLPFEPYLYYMLNKQAGYLSASRSPQGYPTVIDLIDQGDRREGLFPVGRLDKDSRGLLLISDDGRLAHDLLSPKHKVGKTYRVRLDHPATSKDVSAFKEGIYFEEEKTLSQPAELRILEGNWADLTIYEGVYHQVKRMFARQGNEVLDLKRLSMGPLQLDPDLPEGSYRKLTDQELEDLRTFVRKTKK